MPRWTFGDFALDLSTRELLRAGTPIPLSPKAFQLLGVLVQGQGKAFPKNELQERLWPDTFVVEKNLTNLVSEIRDALGDDPSHPRFIRTVHRFGYAFREPATTASRTHNVPAHLTNFVGREQELSVLLRLLASTRLLTLTGAGGCGKTRLAVQLAADVLDRYPDGVWVVDFGPLSDASLVAQSVASVLEVREGPQRPIEETLADHLRPRRMLLVLDNCEHLISACAGLAERLLQSAERLSVLATSREGLGIAGETIWRVPSLALPGPQDGSAVETLRGFDAVRLFVERAAAADPAFTLNGGNAVTVAEICRRLDGIPLALELAAARLTVLSLDQIHSRLNDRFRLLTGGSRTAVARQRTLEATVDWSYQLLSEPERDLLRRLSVFAGGWTIEAAEVIASGDGAHRQNVLDVLSRLVDKSLVIVDGGGDEGRRYRFLETVRQYARERLVESGESERARDGHLSFFHEAVRRAEPELTRERQLSWLNRLQREHDNLRTALEWCLAAPEHGRQGLEFATSLWWFWIKRGYYREGQEWLERALSAAGDVPPTLRARALVALGAMTFFQGEFDRSRQILDESAALGRTAGDLSLASLAHGLSALASLERGDIAACLRAADEGREAGRAGTTPWSQGPSLSCLAYLAMHEGDFDLAGRLHEEVLDLGRQQGEKWGLSIVLFDLALLRVVQQRYADARDFCAEAIALCHEFRDQRGVAWCLGILSGAEAADGDPLRAARLRGAMEGLVESVGAPPQPSYHRWIGDRALGVMREALGERALQDALAEGRALSLERAIALAVQDPDALERP